MESINQKIKKKIDEKRGASPKKILLSFKVYEEFIRENNCIRKFCTKCKKFLDEDITVCPICNSSTNLIDKDLSLITIFNLPYEVTSNVKEVEVI